MKKVIYLNGQNTRSKVYSMNYKCSLFIIKEEVKEDLT